MVGFPHVTDVGVIPLMVARMDKPQGPYWTGPPGASVSSMARPRAVLWLRPSAAERWC